MSVRHVILAALLVLPSPAPPDELPRSSLRVRDGGVWRTWWRSSDAPARWGDRAVLDRHITWHRVSDGVEWGELVIAGRGEAWRTRVIIARVDPTQVRVTLDTAFTGGFRAAWRADRASPRALLAVNAGQFLETLPWGWVVLDGRQFLPPGVGPLSSAVTVDTSGSVRWLHGTDAVDSAAASRHAGWAFQSYPTLLHGGEVPAALRGAGGGVDVAHRDARAALGQLTDGRLLFVITRFDGLRGIGGFVPFGLTTPETAALMGALGARDAVMLDGGISAQMVVRSDGGAVREWRGLRSVPLGLVVLPRP
ncbi:MAG TPA: phosphodiester glycosidase family protein [Gemmatimonadaceae bacterium]|nr:phosphodiester glycosidase family protein [Gemmatimonadaceae bacterium]